MNAPRRLRKNHLIRDLVADVTLDPSDFIYPIFLKNGTAFKQEVKSMPGIFQMSPDLALQEIKELTQQGIKSFIYFAVIDTAEKDPQGSVALSDKNPVNVLMRDIKEQGIDVLSIADLCFCEYTSHGHCGALSECAEETVDNNKTLEMLAEQAVAMCKYGADIIAPSGMMDGMVHSIRQALDENKYHSTPILSYAVKYASSFYGPFRDAAEGAPSFGDRKAYQMDFRRSEEFLTEAELDIQESADMLMVKPAGYYLDVISRIKEQSTLPVGAYQVSGEYSMMHAAAAQGYLDLESVAIESLYSIKRAGASFIISYFAKDLHLWLK